MVTSVLSMKEAGRVMSVAQAVVYSAALLTSSQRITGVSDLAKNNIVTFLIPLMVYDPNGHLFPLI